MSERVDEFWGLKGKRESLASQIEAQLTRIGDADLMLRGHTGRHSGKPWQWVTITGGTGGFPGHVTQSGQTLDASGWPTLKEIADLISQWHSVDHEYRNAWTRLSRDEKAQLASHEPEEINFESSARRRY